MPSERKSPEKCPTYNSSWQDATWEVAAKKMTAERRIIR